MMIAIVLAIGAFFLPSVSKAQEITNTGFESIAEEHVIFSEFTRSQDRANAVLTTICNHNFGGGSIL